MDLNLGPRSPAAEKLWTPSMQARAAVASSLADSVTESSIAPVPARSLPFGLVLAPGRALHQSMISLADQAVASATNFATGIILARGSSKEELGLYMLGFSLIVLFGDLQMSLIATPFMIYAPRLKARAHALYTGSSLIHQLALSLFTVLVLICGALAEKMGAGPRGLGPVLWALSAVSTLIMLREFARRVAFARLKVMNAFFLDCFVAVSQISGLLVLFRFHALSASRAYWVAGLACGVAATVWIWTDRGSCEPRIREALADFNKNWLLGKWVFASGLVWAVAMNLYPWFLAHLHGTASAGVWAACLGVVSVGNPALVGLQNLIGPKVAHSQAANGPVALRRLVVKITAAIALPVTVLCLILIIWGGRLIALLYGRQYAGNNWVVAILAVNLLVSAVSFPYARALFAIDRADLDFLFNFAALFMMVALGFWLVRAYGPVGAATGLLCGNFVTTVLKAGAFLRLPVRISEDGAVHAA
jgi:O-antigen/teichoic acid export membrane protein